MSFIPRAEASMDSAARCELLENLVRLVNEGQFSTVPPVSTNPSNLCPESQEIETTSVAMSPFSNIPGEQAEYQISDGMTVLPRKKTSMNGDKQMEQQAYPPQLKSQVIVLFEEGKRHEVATGLRDENGVKHIFIETICWEHNFRVFDEEAPGKSATSTGPYTDYLVFCRNERPISGTEELCADVVSRAPGTIPDWADVLTSLRLLVGSYDEHGQVRPQSILPANW
jgi:hypothetical protein